VNETTSEIDTPPGIHRLTRDIGFEAFREFLSRQSRIPGSRAVPVAAGYKMPLKKDTGRPNVVWLMADQLRADVFGFLKKYNIQTPNIDRLANESIVFENSFCAEPVCCPARATLMTGHYPSKHGVLHNVGYPMRAEEMVLPKILSKNGYRTGLVGKSHDGRNAGEMWESFEYVEDAFGATMPSKVCFNLKNFPSIKMISPKDGQDCNRVLYGTYPAGPEISKSHLLSTRFMNLLYWHSQDRPFFFSLSLDDPHPPVVPPPPYDSMYAASDIIPEFFDDSGRSLAGKPATVKDWHRFYECDHISPNDYRKHAAHYLGLVSYVDTEIGRILDYLDETGLAQNTIVILNSDHGHMIGEHGLVHKGPFCYDGVIKIPTIIRWPGKIKPGLRNDAIVEGVDFLPTVLDMLGVRNSEEVHGRSLRPLWENPNIPWKEHAFIQWDDYIFCIRGKIWKLTWYESDKTGEMYNIQTDPFEKTNLFAESQYQVERDELLNRLNEWRQKYAT